MLKWTFYACKKDILGFSDESNGQKCLEGE